MINISSCSTRFQISVIDDRINEASEQIFVVMVEVVSALHPSLITISSEDMFTLVRIVDDDRKWDERHLKSNHLVTVQVSAQAPSLKPYCQNF